MDRSLKLPEHEVRALLREVQKPGTGKTRHSFLLTPQPVTTDTGGWVWETPHYTATGSALNREFPRIAERCYPVKPGDRFWVQETWAISVKGCAAPRLWYRAALDGDAASCVKMLHGSSVQDFGRAREGVWRPSTQMSRWASRITLIVSGVEICRLHDMCAPAIIEREARAEGIWHGGSHAAGAARMAVNASAAQHWDMRHGRGSFDGNPFVAVCRFTVHGMNIDTMANEEPQRRMKVVQHG